MNFFIVSGGRISVAYDLPRGFTRPATSVSPGKERITSNQKSLSDMQIARLVLSEVNDKMRRAAHYRPWANGDLDKVVDSTPSRVR